MTDQPVKAYDESKRMRLIEAAATAFSRVGFDRASVEEIADAADVGKGTVYLYFSSKEELFLSVLWELKERLAGALTAVPAPGWSVKAFIRAHLLLADEAADLLRCYVSALFGVNREFQSAALEMFSWQQYCLRDALQRDKRVRSDAEVVVIAGCVNATALLRTLGPGVSNRTDMSERLLMALVEGPEP